MRLIVTIDLEQPLETAVREHGPAILIAAAVTPEGVRVALDVGAVPHRSRAAVAVRVDRFQSSEASIVDAQPPILNPEPFYIRWAA